MPFNQVGILGTGLIGCSVAKAIKVAQPKARILGFDSILDVVRRAEQTKAIDRAMTLPQVVEGSDLIIVAAPVGAMQKIFGQMAPHLKPGAVVMDTGSTKAQVLEWAEELLPANVSFVGGHPMAGKTETGPEAADAALFAGRIWCIAPSANADRSKVDDAIALVESFGAVPYFVDPHEHDGLVASISHLPYLMSVALVRHLSVEPAWKEAATLAAGGFAYASHLAASDPRMFADVSATNREHLVHRLDAFINEMEALRNAIAVGDEALITRFEEAQQSHRDWLNGVAQQKTPAEVKTEAASMRDMFFGGIGRKKKDDDDTKK